MCDGTSRWSPSSIGLAYGLELFAYSLKINGVRLVGSRTAGALLAGRAFLLPDDSLLEIAVADAVIGDNVRLEGAGVEPDCRSPSTCLTPPAGTRSASRRSRRCGECWPASEVFSSAPIPGISQPPTRTEAQGVER